VSLCAARHGGLTLATLMAVRDADGVGSHSPLQGQSGEQPHPLGLVRAGPFYACAPAPAVCRDAAEHCRPFDPKPGDPDWLTPPNAATIRS
jgi:hypothetical protein